MKSVRDKQAAQRLEVFVILKKGERIATIHVHRGHTGKRHVGTTYGEQSAWGPNEPSYVELMAGLYVDGNRMYLPNVEPPELTQLLEEYHRAHARMLTTCDPGGAPKSNDAADKILRRAGAIGASIGGTAPFDPKTGERLIWRDRSVFRVEGAPFEDVWYTGYAHCTFLPGLDRIRVRRVESLISIVDGAVTMALHSTKIKDQPMSSSTPRVQNLRARRAEAGLTHFRMRAMRHEWEEMEQLRAAVLAMRGEHVPEPKNYTSEWTLWLTPSERELAQSTRDLLVARRSM